jgi:hypothetical protein
MRAARSVTANAIEDSAVIVCLHVAVKSERNFLRLAEITSKCRNAGRELLLSCARGCFSGLGIGFFMFLRLGAPATHELTGYMVGLFLLAGLKFGFFLWVIRSFVFPLLTHFRRPSSPS